MLFSLYLIALSLLEFLNFLNVSNVSICIFNWSQSNINYGLKKCIVSLNFCSFKFKQRQFLWGSLIFLLLVITVSVSATGGNWKQRNIFLPFLFFSLQNVTIANEVIVVTAVPLISTTGACLILKLEDLCLFDGST